jgi:hypothetical protein
MEESGGIWPAIEALLLLIKQGTLSNVNNNTRAQATGRATPALGVDAIDINHSANALFPHTWFCYAASCSAGMYDEVFLTCWLH